MGALHPTYIVGIGGSAGALHAYTGLLDLLPSKTGMAFVFVYHVTPTANTQLALILSRHTTMPVLLAANAMLIQANHVYVIPQNADLFIEGDAFKVVSPRTGRNNQIDLFFISLAEAKGERAIGIILSGYDGDGTAGCKHIKATGGTTFTQDRSAEVIDMPLSAQASGCIDFVLPLDKISDELQRLGTLDQKVLRPQLARHRAQMKKRG
jgi:chemotaxis response regulator CheB